MSLYIGKLSRRTCRDDLEDAFTRFGRCEVRIKDGFGFVVYDFPPNAEKALEAFQGRSICGERLTISWSKKQPRGFPKFARSDRTYETQRGRIFARGGVYDQREYKMNMNRLNNDRRRATSADMFQEKDNDYKEEHHDYRESLPNEGGGVESSHGDFGRWGDQVRDFSNDHRFENGVELERYETKRGNERQTEYENSVIAGRSPSPGSPQEKIERVQIGEGAQGHSNDSKVKARCYNCGVMGHKKLNCPRGYRKFTRFDRGHDSEVIKEDRGKGNLERHESSPRGEVQLGKDTSRTHRGKDRVVSGLRKHEMLLNSGSSPTRKKNDKNRRKDYKGKKRSGNEIRISKERITKRTRRSLSSVSSPIQSEYAASRSHSMSQLSKSQQRNSRSRSRSVSNRARSFSSNSRLSSRSYCSGSTSPKSRSRYNSHTSLSASAGLSLPSPPNGIHLSCKGSLSNATTESKKVSVKPDQLGEVDLGSHGANVNGTNVSMNDEKALSAFNMEDDIGKEQSLHLQQMSGSPFEMTNPCTPQLDKGYLSIGSSPSPSLEETRELSVSGALVKEHMLTPFEKPDFKDPLSSCTSNSTSISAEELKKVLKHYGLALPEQNERCLSAEDYFGSSRLWPWEIIYYRRLKKGPISTENYARRLAQNGEFGIMDKYIRSSSGWVELRQDIIV